MREIVLDTETTGINPAEGHRVVEIGCVEVLNAIPTGRVFHRYINPERDMPDGAFQVHGLSEAFLSDKPVFSDVAQDFVEFLGPDRLVAHNAGFDVNFLNHELTKCGFDAIGPEQVVDTLAIARRKHSGASNSLDALCSRYGIDLSRRTKHGALLDAELLAEVYLELSGGRQAGLDFLAAGGGQGGGGQPMPQRKASLPSRLSDAESVAHREFIATFENSLWAEIWNAQDDNAFQMAAQ